MGDGALSEFILYIRSLYHALVLVAHTTYMNAHVHIRPRRVI